KHRWILKNQRSKPRKTQKTRKTIKTVVARSPDRAIPPQGPSVELPLKSVFIGVHLWLYHETNQPQIHTNEHRKSQMSENAAGAGRPHPRPTCGTVPRAHRMRG